MKTILVTTDFSAPSQNAGRFALYLANVLKSDLILCHAVKMLAASSLQILPTEYAIQRDLAVEQLEFQALNLRSEEQESGISGPHIDYSITLGSVTDMVSRLSRDKPITLVVMGIFGAGMLNRVLLGSNSQDLINNASLPVLLIPFRKFPKKIDKIAFASDLSKGDVGLINSLAGFARAFNAEILIVHTSETEADQAQVDSFLSEVTGKINYPKIYYRHVEDKSVNHGLNWIAKNGFIDVFAMVHRKHHFPGYLFSSHTEKLSRKLRYHCWFFRKINIRYFNEATR